MSWYDRWRRPVRIVDKRLRRRGDKWVVTDEEGKKVLGEHATKEEALAQLRAIEANKERIAQALAQTFVTYAANKGLVFKSESVQAEFVAPWDDGGIYRVTWDDGFVYMAEAGGNVVPLPSYLPKTGYVPVRKSDEKRYTLGVVYPRDQVDFHGDTMSEDELEKAAWAFMAKDGISKRVGLLHKPGTDGAGTIVESYIYRGPEWKQKSANGDDVQVVRSGDWLLGVVWEPEAWEAIKSGKITGYSLQGLARKEEA